MLVEPALRCRLIVLVLHLYPDMVNNTFCAFLLYFALSYCLWLLLFVLSTRWQAIKLRLVTAAHSMKSFHFEGNIL